MNNKFTRAISALLAFATAAGVMCLSGCGKEVNTYSVSEMAYVDNWIDSSESYGEVRTVNMQNVFASESIDVQEIYVKEGQRVKKGDKLLAYDTSLTDIELEKKELEVMTLKLALENAEKELRTINSYKPMVITTIIPPAIEGGEGTQVSGCASLGGAGTEEDPYIFVVEDGYVPCSEAFVESICPAGSDRVWAVFQKRAGNMSNGIISDYWGICYYNTVSGSSMKFFDAFDFCQNPPTEPYEEIEYNSGLTAAEISKMRVSAKERIKEADFEYRVADLEYQQMKLERDGGIIYAELDGTVEFINDADSALEEGLPVLRVSENGGYIVEGTLSELELGTVSIGQTVKVTSWELYSEYEAQITSISDMPTTQNGWSSGNSNVSYYPFTVYIDGSANLKENEFVSMTYSSKGYDDSSFYLEKPFILNENGSSYVYVRNEEGKLEKRRIETGESLWGSYLRIVSGLTMDDRIAFPYDKNAKDGAATREAELSELYM